MPGNKWDDDRIEQLLQDFPKIEDHRTKDEVYNRLKKSMVKPKEPKRWLPLTVAALAFLTVAVLLASMLLGGNGLNTAFEQTSESSSSGAEEGMAQESSDTAGELAPDILRENDEAAMDAAESGEEEASLAVQEVDSKTAVYEKDLTDKVLFSVGVTENASVIPVSFLIPQEQVQNDLGTTQPDAVSLYNFYAPLVEEEALGFDNYHPYAGTLSMNDNTIEHRLPAGHPYDQSSAAIFVYINSIQESFSKGAGIVVLNEDGMTAEFGEVGPMEPIQANAGRNAYYTFTTGSGSSYLVPDYGRTFDSAANALEALAASPSDLLASPIPEEIEYTVEEEGATAIVSFDEPLDLTALDETEAGRMLESFALTAASFGSDVKLENTVQSEWNGFDFSGALEKPVAPNKLAWNFN